MRARLAMPLVVAATAVGLGVFAPTSAPASCVGPSLSVPGAPSAAPTTLSNGRPLPSVRLAAGQSVTVRGTWFFRGCNDTSGSGGCSAPETPKPERPARDVELTLRQGDKVWNLGSADAGPPSSEYAVRWDAVLPEDLRPGTAVLAAGPTARLHVLVSSG